jgi:predicted ATP-grasp superfamily ATP-dependent carboligase
MKIFVTDGNLRSTLGVVRSLGRAGFFVGTGNDSAGMIAGSSRYCRERLLYPSPASDPVGFCRFLRTELRRRGYTHLLATSDMTTQLVASMKSELAPDITAMNEDAETLARVQDKGLVLSAAAGTGVGVPRCISVCSRRELLEFAEQAGYPVVIKPRRSRHYAYGGWSEGSVRYAHNPSELIDMYESVSRVIPEPLVQERIQGDGRGVFLLMWQGEVKAAFCHRRLREKPPWGGVSVLSESLAPDTELIDRSAALLRGLEWSGPAMVEFKMDARDGQPKLMEVNGRFWGSLQLAIDAGIDFPLLYLRLVLGEDVTPQLHYRAGVQCRWLLGDLDALMTMWSARAEQKFLCAPISRAKLLADFLRFAGKDLHYDVWSLADPMPSCEELRQYAGINLRLLFGRSRAALNGAKQWAA